MKKLVAVSFFAAFILTACMVTPGPPGSGAVMVSPLPPIVVLDDDPYYYQNGYYYFYDNDNWRYSTSRGGPWADLPRSHWPKEIRHRHRHGDHDRDDYPDRDFRHGHDDR